jgi:lipopolysaccharide assembly outer membrane protein LptD (OstA)
LITCDNLDLKINENYAVAYNNVIIKDNKSIMKAQMVTLNIITKDIKINSQNKVENQQYLI